MLFLKNLTKESKKQSNSTQLNYIEIDVNKSKWIAKKKQVNCKDI